jgi:hypothetical protein
MPSTPPILFHYTSSAGMIGIISHEQIWLTSIHYLNDSREFSIACNCLTKQISKAASDGRIAKDYSNYLLRITEDYSNVVVYVMSFCENGDLLSLWRGYCPSGPGYAVGFDTNFLILLAERQTKTGDLMRLEKCVYETAQHDLMADEIINRVVTSYPDLHGREDLIRNSYAAEMVLFAPLIKDPSFAEEKEWRLCVHPKTTDKIVFRAGKSFLIPYLEIKLGGEPKWKESVKRVHIGPTPQFALSSASVTTLLRTKNHTACEEPIWSLVPYRTW